MKRRSSFGLAELQLDRASSTPLHQQVFHYLRRAIVEGHLLPGASLPSTRALARRLGVSRNTVLNAYEALAVEGYLAGKVGAGTRVRPSVDPMPRVHFPGSVDVRRMLREAQYPVNAQMMSDPDGNPIYFHR